MPSASNGVRADVIANLKLWLIDNGVEWFYHGWFQPTQQSVEAGQYPLVALIPDDPPERMNASSQFGFEETGRILCVLWLLGSDENRLKPARDQNGEPILDRGDFTVLDTWHQKLLAGPNPFAQYFPKYTGAQGVTGGSVEWEEFWWTAPPYVAAQFNVEYHTRVAPETIPDPNQ